MTPNRFARGIAAILLGNLLAPRPAAAGLRRVARIAEAHELVEGGQVIGNVVVSPGPEG